MIALAKIAKSYHVCHISIRILTHCGSYKSTDAGEVMLPFHRQMMRNAPRPASLGGAAAGPRMVPPQWCWQWISWIFPFIYRLPVAEINQSEAMLPWNPQIMGKCGFNLSGYCRKCLHPSCSAPAQSEPRLPRMNRSVQHGLLINCLVQNHEKYWKIAFQPTKWWKQGLWFPLKCHGSVI